PCIQLDKDAIAWLINYPAGNRENREHYQPRFFIYS
ncbi:unnamed protein product, partial [marine sediment metagenome]